MSVWARQGLPFHRWLCWRAAWLITRLTVAPLLRVKVVGKDRIPKTGGAMLLANHSTFWDFLLCFWGIYRPASGIGSEQVFRLPVAGFVLTQLNGIPFSKGVKDGAAVRRLAEAYERGTIIGMFPEGKRSWTGAPLPIKRGTGRLVKSLGCPVIYCRVYTGFLQHPRWATWPRWIRWHMEYSAPEHFPPEATGDEINAAIARGLAIDPEHVELPPGSWGFRLAVGLPEFLWACPSCFAMESLVVPAEDRDCVTCSECSRRWRVDLRCQLNGETPDTPTFSVDRARARLSEHIPPTVEITCDAMEITGIERGRLSQKPIASGPARLTDEAIEVYRGDEVLWSVRYSDMKAVLIQVRNALHVRVEGANYQFDPQGQSRLRWHYFLAGRSKATSG